VNRKAEPIERARLVLELLRLVVVVLEQLNDGHYWWH